METTREQVILDHIMENADNARIAFEIAARLPEAWTKLVERTFGQIECRLKEQAYGGDLDILNEFSNVNPTTQRVVSFLVRRQSWPEEIRVGFTTENTFARDASIGMKCAKHQESALAPVTQALDAKVGQRSPKPFDFWPWYQWLTAPLNNWYTYEAIAKFAPLSGERDAPAVNELFEMLDGVITTADPHLRELAGYV